jgi:DNA-binding transcriptional LysR family regulator
MSAAVHRTARAASASPTLVVTAKPGAPMDLLRRIVNSCTALPGTSRVEIVVSGYRQQAKMVREGHADVALLSSPYDERGLDTHPLITEPRVAALPVGHDLAHRDILRCRDLHGEPIPQWPESDPTERAYWSGRDRDFLTNGHIESQPDLSEHGPVVSDITQLLEVVQLGQAVALIPRFLAESNPRVGIAYRPVVDASPYTLVIVWAKGSRARSIFAFVSTAITLTAHDESGNNDLPIEPEGNRATRDSSEYSRNRSS